MKVDTVNTCTLVFLTAGEENYSLFFFSQAPKRCRLGLEE